MCIDGGVRWAVDFFFDDVVMARVGGRGKGETNKRAESSEEKKKKRTKEQVMGWLKSAR